MVLIRPMRREDLPQVNKIEREAFPTQWPPPSYDTELKSKLSHYVVACKDSVIGEHQKPPQERAFLPGIKGLVLKARRLWREESLPPPPQLILGFSGIWYLFEEAHLTTIAVRASYQQQGIGELLLISSIELSQQLGAQAVTLEVRVSNKPAQALYEKYGFRVVGRRRGYYTDNGEDGIIMTTDRITSASYQALFQELKEAHYHKWGLRSPSTLPRA